jgi:hypothetical protein
MADKYIGLINGTMTEVEAKTTSSGASDSGKVVALDGTGRLDTSMMPVGIGADTMTANAFEALAAGDFVYIKTDGTVAKASAGVSGVPSVGFVISAVSLGQPATVYFEGRNTALSGLTIGSRYYLSETAGGATTTPVTGAGKKHQVLGTAVSATTISFEADDYVVLA